VHNLTSSGRGYLSNFISHPQLGGNSSCTCTPHKTEGSNVPSSSFGHLFLTTITHHSFFVFSCVVHPIPSQLHHTGSTVRFLDPTAETQNNRETTFSETESDTITTSTSRGTTITETVRLVILILTTRERSRRRLVCRPFDRTCSTATVVLVFILTVLLCCGTIISRCCRSSRGGLVLLNGSVRMIHIVIIVIVIPHHRS